MIRVGGSLAGRQVFRGRYSSICREYKGSNRLPIVMDWRLRCARVERITSKG